MKIVPIKRLLIKTAVAFTAIFAIYLFLVSSLNPIFKNSEFVYLENKIHQAQDSDFEEFADLYLKIYNDKSQICPCEAAARFIGPYRHGLSPTKALYELRLNREFEQKQCIYFLLKNTEFYRVKGIEDAAKLYFKKSLYQTTYREKIALVGMMKNTSLYNPIRNPEGVETRVNVLVNKLKNKNGS